MKSILEELYSANFTIRNDSRKAFNKECELSRQATTNEEKLKEGLNAVQRSILEKLIDCHADYRYHCCKEEFISGFRLGSRLVMEILFGEMDTEFRY